jgi:uncharacterized protein (TIGR03083 family)
MGEQMSGHRQWVETLAASHANLVDVVAQAGDVSAPSYCSDWAIAQVLSHLGSGAEIGLLNLEATLAGEPAPDREKYVAIWDVWNAKSPEAMAADGLAFDARLVERFSGLDDATLDGMNVEMFGRQLDASGLVAMRMGEHVLHTWDIAVMKDPNATVFAPATALLNDLTPSRMGFMGRGERHFPTPARIEFVTSDPASTFSVVVGPESLETLDEQGTDGRVELPAEALLRLAFGRLGAAHEAGAKATGSVSLDDLRALFPGF